MNPPTLRLLASILAIFTLASPARAQTASQAVLTELDQLVADNQGKGGGIVRIADRTGVLCQGAAGKFAGPASPDMTPDTPFEIASITKAVTAATILVLTEEGKTHARYPHWQGAPGEKQRKVLMAPSPSASSCLTPAACSTTGPTAHATARATTPSSAPSSPTRATNWTPDEILSYAREIPSRRRAASTTRIRTSFSSALSSSMSPASHSTPFTARKSSARSAWSRPGFRTTKPRRGMPQSHRYEGSEDLTDVPRQSADWAGGGLVSTARDLERFLRGLADGKLFHNPQTLQAMLTFVPTGEQDISYGLGLYRVKLDGGLGEVWGHDGHGNSFAYYWPQRGVTFTGTLNQVNNDWWPLVEAWVSGGKSLSDFEKTARPSTPASRPDGTVYTWTRAQTA